MSNKKRPSETAQMRREDYESQYLNEDDNGNDHDKDDSGQGSNNNNSSKAQEQQSFHTTGALSGRRIVRARHPGLAEQSAAAAPKATTTTDTTSPAKKTNFFANVFLTVGNDTNTTPTTKSHQALFGNTTTATSTFSATSSSSTTTTTPAAPPVTKKSKLASCVEWMREQDQILVERVTDADLGHADQSPMTWAYSYFRVLKEYQLRTKEAGDGGGGGGGAENKPTPSAPPPSSGSATTTTAKGNHENAQRAPATTTTTATTSTTNNAPLFSFGAPSSSSSSSTAAPAASQSPAAPTTPFKFGASNPSSLSLSTTSTNAKPFGGFSFPSSSSPAGTASGTAGAASATAKTPTIGFVFGGGGGGSNQQQQSPPPFKTDGASSSFASPPPASTSITTEKGSVDSFVSSAAQDTPRKGNTTLPNDSDNDAVRKEKDPDWDEVETFPAVKMYHLEDARNTNSAWKNFAAGPLYIQKHKQQQQQQQQDSQSAHRLVMRNSSGTKVLVNMKLFPDMKFLLTTTEPNKQNQWFGILAFCGTNDAERGMESLKLKTDPQSAQALLDKLQSIVAGLK
ncbi:hypothetical protein ACA910_015935 [Epithemia clementina (nom. ined.)]